VEAERDGVLVLVYLQGGKLWSEVEPGTTFSDWLSDQFGLDCKNWPLGLEMHTTDDLDQQHEWVGATATRSGDGTLKPREALTDHAAQTHWPTGIGMPKPKVGNPVKVALGAGTQTASSVRQTLTDAAGMVSSPWPLGCAPRQ
jgi:hypothetical protein